VLAAILVAGSLGIVLALLNAAAERGVAAAGPDRGRALPDAGPPADARLVDRINALLPQTQCGRCTFTGCKPYATALARGEADINQCPPGGSATAAALAALLGCEFREVDPKYGSVPSYPVVALIDEQVCIGCAKCILACPVDAIVGAPKFMHTVIAAQCTGCELCIPPCPVDCIEMRPTTGNLPGPPPGKIPGKIE
jgi:electron transport complex protein RnfB